MDKVRVKRFIAVCVALFAMGVLLIGKYSPSETNLSTIYIKGINQTDTASRIQELVQSLSGVRSVFVDGCSQLLTVQYDSGSTDIQAFRKCLMGAGLSIEEIKGYSLLSKATDENKRIISVKRTSN